MLTKQQPKSMQVSIYKNIKDTTSSEKQQIAQVLSDIQEGKWQDICLKVASEKNKEKRQQLKSQAPYFTPSGVFLKRNNESIKEYSGLIAIDFDDVSNISSCFAKLIKDQYTYSCFRSISGTGLCALVKINSEKHLESFLGLQEYYWQLLKIPIDKACKDLSRPRYISYDPDLYINDKSKTFKIYPKKKQEVINKEVNYIHSSNKFERIISEINKDITGDYHEWVSIGFAIASEYGESGEHYFHSISQFHPDYDYNDCSRQYKFCCREGKGITISSFYYYAKLNGLNINNDREKLITNTAYFGKVGGRQPEATYGVLATKQIDLTEQEKELIQKVYDTPNFKPDGLEQSSGIEIDKIETFIKTNYDIKRNLLTRAYEMNGKELESEDLNSIFIQSKKIFKKLSREIFDTIIFSNFTQNYNPLLDYFNKLHWDGVDRLNDLTKVITSNTGTFEWRKELITKWMIGILETIYTGSPNILNLVLTGKPNTGKTQFFKRLLPGELKPYFANSQMDKGKDDEILMTQKLIIFDDEYSGKSKQDSKRIKMLLSADSFTLREPYGKKNVTLRRIATFCGTCNEIEVLNDLTGNRRIIVIEAVDTFNYDLFNSINKTQLFAQIKALYDAGENSLLSNQQISELDKYTTGIYSETSIEGELIVKFFKRSSEVYDFLTTSEIKDYIETHTKQKLSVKKVGMELRRLNYERVKKDGQYGYYAASLNSPHSHLSNNPPPF
jgi:hypothetical protein